MNIYSHLNKSVLDHVMKGENNAPADIYLYIYKSQPTGTMTLPEGEARGHPLVGQSLQLCCTQQNGPK